MGESQVTSRRARSAIALIAIASIAAFIATTVDPAHALPTPIGVPYASASHYPLPEAARQLVATSDGSALFAATDSATVLMIDPATKKVRRSIALPGKVSHLALTRSGMIDAIDLDGDATSTPPAVYELAPDTGDVAKTTMLPTGFRATAFALTPDGTTAAVAEVAPAPQTSGRPIEAVVIHPATGAVGVPAVVDGYMLSDVIGISPDGSKVFALSLFAFGPKNRQGTLETVDMTTGTASAPLALDGSSPEDLVVSPDGTRVFVVNEDGPDHQSPVDVVDVASDTIISTILSKPYYDSFDSAQLTSDGSEVVVAGQRETLAIDPTTLASREIDGEGEKRDSVLVPGTSRILTTDFSGFREVDEIDAVTGKLLRFSVLAQDYDPARAVVLPGDHDLYYAATTAAGTPELAHFDLAAGSNRVGMDRFDGSDQYSTDVGVMSDAQTYTGSDLRFGYIVSGQSAAEDLSVAAAAAHQRAEVVLTAPGALPAAIRTFEEYRSLKALFIIGGNASVSPYVRSQLVYLTRHRTVIVRIAGGDHYATSRAVVRQAFGTRLKHVWITTGNGSSDAMAASSAASYRGEPVLAVNGSASALDANTATFLRQEKATSFTVVGGTSAVSSGVAASLAKIAPVTRIAGSDAIETSQLVNASVFPTTQNEVFFASVGSWQDQLLANQLAVIKHDPVDIVPQNCVPDAIAEHLGSQDYASAEVIGSTAELSAEVANDATC
jgi:putative cell wall-binding protein